MDSLFWSVKFDDEFLYSLIIYKSLPEYIFWIVYKGILILSFNIFEIYSLNIPNIKNNPAKEIERKIIILAQPLTIPALKYLIYTAKREAQIEKRINIMERKIGSFVPILEYETKISTAI